MSPALLLGCIAVLARVAVACLFGAAAVGKLRRRADFAGAVAGYRLLPAGLVAPVALALPPLEIAIAIGLLAGMPLAITAGSALLALFAAAMAINLLRGRRDVDCGCDPTARARPITWTFVARNLLLGALLLTGLVAAPALPLPVLVAAGGAGALAFLLGHILSLLGSFAAPRDTLTSGAR